MIILIKYSYVQDNSNRVTSQRIVILTRFISKARSVSYTNSLHDKTSTFERSFEKTWFLRSLVWTFLIEIDTLSLGSLRVPEKGSSPLWHTKGYPQSTSHSRCAREDQRNMDQKSFSEYKLFFYVLEEIHTDLWNDVEQVLPTNGQIVAHAKIRHQSEETKNKLQSSVRQLFKENNDNLHSYTHKQMLLLFVTRDSGQRDHPHHPTSLHLLKTTGNRCMDPHSSCPALSRKGSLLVLCIFFTSTRSTEIGFDG